MQRSAESPDTSAEFRDRTVIVTGAGRGLGRAYATALAERGARVVVNDLALETPEGAGAQDTVDVIAQAGGAAVACPGSVAEPAVAGELVRLARECFGPVDAVINNAGNGGASDIAGTDADDVRRFHDVHVLGSFNVAKAAWPDLRSQRRGRVVNTVSGVGMLGLPRAVAYAAAKGGVLGLTRALAVDGAGEGVAVNAVAPIAVTAMAKSRFDDGGADLDVRHVAAVVLWLASTACLLNGEIVSAGGRRVARWTVGVNEGEWLDDVSPAAVSALWPAVSEDPAVLPLADALAEVEFVQRGPQPA